MNQQLKRAKIDREEQEKTDHKLIDLTDPITVIIIFRLSYFKNDISRTLSFPLKNNSKPNGKRKKVTKEIIILRRKWCV